MDHQNYSTGMRLFMLQIMLLIGSDVHCTYIVLFKKYKNKIYLAGM